MTAKLHSFNRGNSPVTGVTVHIITCEKSLVGVSLTVAYVLTLCLFWPGIYSQPGGSRGRCPFS